MHKQQDDRKLENTVKQRSIHSLGRASQGVNWSCSQCIKSHLRSDVFSKRATKPLLKHEHHQKHLTSAKEKRTGLLLSGPKSSFQMKVHLYLIWKSRSQRLEEEWRDKESSCLKSSVKFPQSVMIWAAMSSAGVGPLCFLKSTVNAAIYQEILEHFMLPSADKLYGDAEFIFQQDLAPAHTAKGTKSWFNGHGVTVLDWPANSPDLNPKENLSNHQNFKK